MRPRCRSRACTYRGIPVAELRQLEIFLTPHGFLKGAMVAKDGELTSITLPFAGPTNAGMTENGRKATIVSYVAMARRVPTDMSLRSTVDGLPKTVDRGLKTD